MKNILLMAAAVFVASGCAARETVKPEPAPAPKPTIEKECIDLTPEYKAQINKHEAFLSGARDFIQSQLTEITGFLTVTTGKYTEAEFREAHFAGEYSVALVRLEVLQGTENNSVGSLYLVLANDTHSPYNWRAIEMFAQGPVRVQMMQHLKEMEEKSKRLEAAPNEYKL